MTFFSDRQRARQVTRRKPTDYSAHHALSIHLGAVEAKYYRRLCPKAMIHDKYMVIGRLFAEESLKNDTLSRMISRKSRKIVRTQRMRSPFDMRDGRLPSSIRAQQVAPTLDSGKSIQKLLIFCGMRLRLLFHDCIIMHDILTGKYVRIDSLLADQMG